MHQVKMKRQGFVKNKVMAWLVEANVDKVNLIPHTNVISSTFEGMMVTMFGGCNANTILVLFIRSMPLSLSMQIALANGHYEAIFASIKLLFYCCVPTLHDTLPSPGVNPLEGSPKCSCGKLGLGRCSWLLAL
jgi:hypothetical protein